jgi:hypothetical protein
MSFFNLAEPIFRPKQESLDFQDRQGIWQIQLKIKNQTLFSTIYTRIDQVFVIWGLISAAIFISAQFSPIVWTVQAIIWSALTAIGSICMFILTYFWVRVERLEWLLYGWLFLMVVGLIITDLAIFCGWGRILLHLCDIWLGLSSIGYICTGIGLRSRAFIVSAIVHILGIAILPWFNGWHFLITGLVMTANLIIFAETQWDMRPPIENYGLLSEQQKEFNRQQYTLRQSEI